jgi:hypothetical protein
VGQRRTGSPQHVLKLLHRHALRDTHEFIQPSLHKLKSHLDVVLRHIHCRQLGGSGSHGSILGGALIEHHVRKRSARGMKSMKAQTLDSLAGGLRLVSLSRPSAM